MLRKLQRGPSVSCLTVLLGVGALACGQGGPGKNAAPADAGTVTSDPAAPSDAGTSPATITDPAPPLEAGLVMPEDASSDPGDGSVPELRAGDASVAAVPDGGFVAPCDAVSGLWRFASDLSPFLATAERVDAVLVDFELQRVVATTSLHYDPMRAEWTGAIDPESLGQSCATLVGRYVPVLVSRDDTGRINGASQDRSVRDTRFIGALSGSLGDCRASLNVLSPDATANTDLELFAWFTHTSLVSSVAHATRVPSSVPPNFLISYTERGTCSYGDHPVFFVVAHDHGSRRVLSAYAGGDY